MNLSLTGAPLLEVYPDRFSIKDVLREKVQDTASREYEEDPFHVVNLGRLIHLYKRWQKMLPNVQPFYAVKCNYDPMLLQTLAGLGTGFDCASKEEISTILGLGVHPSRIIYANPCKQVSHIRYAASVGVHLMTFDNEVELHKTKSHDPLARLVLRIIADDPTATVHLGEKYGACLDQVSHLLTVAKQLDLNVVGISFHVGSGAQSAAAYSMALGLAKQAFTIAETLGFTMEVLDIGGGFPGSSDSEDFFEEITTTIRSSLDKSFGEYDSLQIIAEPGRYFACSTHVLAVNVIAKRPSRSANSQPMYYINDSNYSSFSCLLYGHVKPQPVTLKDTDGCEVKASSVWGPTCDCIDKINDAVMLPELDVGDWLYYVDMGAYTVCAYSAFNGFPRPKSFYYCREHDREELQSLLNIPSKVH